MFKSIIFVTVFVQVCLAGHFDSHEHHELPKETEHHHEVDHKHATSHQSFHMHHFHAVPTYIKKEDQEFIKHPVEISGVKHNLKIVHPETEHHHGHGLTLENHQEVHDHKAADFGDSHAAYESGHEGGHDFGGHDFGGHHEFEHHHHEEEHH